MARPLRRIEIGAEQDAALELLESNPGMHAKVRLRASILRLHRLGWNAPQLARHFRRSLASVHSDLDRFEQHGLEGMTDKPPPGRPFKTTLEIQAFIHERLQDERVWHAKALGEAIRGTFQVRVATETVRQQLRALGFTWKKAGYSPVGPLGPEVEQESQASPEILARGRWMAR